MDIMEEDDFDSPPEKKIRFDEGIEEIGDNNFFMKFYILSLI